jgi:hypothetical protein
MRAAPSCSKSASGEEGGITKPFSIVALASKLRELLHKL